MTATEPAQRRIILLGGGEHACVVADAIAARRDAGHPADVVEGYAGPAGGQIVERRFGLPYLGTDRHVANERVDVHFVLALGAPQKRRVALDELRRETRELRFATVVHPRAAVSSSARLEPGAVVMAGAVVNTGAVVGEHAIVNSGAIVEHDVEVGALTHVAPGATVGGGARIGRDVFVGLGAHVRDHISIGDRAVVGMGAVVVNDIDAGDTVVGVPARVVRRGQEGDG